jgi:hypothetical protein
MEIEEQEKIARCINCCANTYYVDSELKSSFFTNSKRILKEEFWIDCKSCGKRLVRKSNEIGGWLTNG